MFFEVSTEGQPVISLLNQTPPNLLLCSTWNNKRLTGKERDYNNGYGGCVMPVTDTAVKAIYRSQRNEGKMAGILPFPRPHNLENRKRPHTGRQGSPVLSLPWTTARRFIHTHPAQKLFSEKNGKR